MLKIRKELAAIMAWDEAEFPCRTDTEVVAIRIRAIRKSELPKQAYEIAQIN